MPDIEIFDPPCRQSKSRHEPIVGDVILGQAKYYSESTNVMNHWCISMHIDALMFKPLSRNGRPLLSLFPSSMSIVSDVKCSPIQTIFQKFRRMFCTAIRGSPTSLILNKLAVIYLWFGVLRPLQRQWVLRNFLSHRDKWHSGWQINCMNNTH